MWKIAELNNRIYLDIFKWQYLTKVSTCLKLFIWNSISEILHVERNKSYSGVTSRIKSECALTYTKKKRKHKKNKNHQRT